MSASDQGGADLLDRLPYRKFVLVILTLHSVLVLATAVGTLRRFPNSADEYAYLVSAEIFAEGRLSVPSPEPLEFFTVTHVLNNGKFYGKYPPGWPALLAVGVKVGLPWVVNPLLGLGALALMAAVAKEAFSEREARIALLAGALSPFLVFNAASYFSHVACLAGVAAALLGFLRAQREPSNGRAWLLAGAGGAVAFLARPFTGVAALALPGLAVVATLARGASRGSLARGIGLCGIGLSAAAALFLLYNRAQTGDPLVMPFSAYDVDDKPSLPHSLPEAIGRVRGVGMPSLMELNRWMPLSLFGLLIFAFDPECRRLPSGRLLLLSAAGVLAAYLLYPSMGGNRYGPRYLLESLAGALPILAAVIRRHPGLERWALGAVLVLSLAGLAYATRVHFRQVRERMAVYDLAERQELRNAVIFLRTGSGSMPPGDLTRNGTRFDGPVLYVQDLGPANARLLRAYPGRASFLYEFDERTRRGALLPYEPPSEKKP